MQAVGALNAIISPQPSYKQPFPSVLLRGDGKYDLDFKTENNDGSKVISGDALADLYRDWAKRYPVVSVEDPFDQDDWDNWVKYTASVGHQVVGDDLTVTNPKRIQMGIDKKACNCLLLKVNQVRWGP